MRGMARKKGEGTSGKRRRVRKPGPPPGWVPLTEEEFEEELVRRMEEITSGKVKTIPLDVALRQIHEERLRRRGDR